MKIVFSLTVPLFSRSRDILDDFREAYYWLWQNTKEDATVMSWWDYGYQIAGMANRTTLVDNNTWNNSHIALVIYCNNGIFLLYFNRQRFRLSLKLSPSFNLRV